MAGWSVTKMSKLMYTHLLVATIISVIGFSTVLCQDNLVNLTFPSTFKFGAATSAYQIEGGWNEDGKGENLWDFISHTYPNITKNGNGDIACDSYHKYKEDVKILKELGVDYYRFSLSWSRILPTGFANEVNLVGIQYYQNLLDELEAANIEPLVTLFHFDMPMSIHVLGNTQNPKIADYFVEYADIAFKYFGDRVKLWTTFNEPYIYCAYLFDDIFANYFNYIPTGFVEYNCGHTILKAHAKTYRMYEEKYKATQGGKLSMNFIVFWNEPATNSSEDIGASNRKNHFDLGWFAHPIFWGNYPQVMRENIARISAIQNFSKSRLPEFTKEEIEYIKGTYDFFALNHYSSYLVKPNYYENQNNAKPSFNSDIEVTYFEDPSWGDSSIFKILPWGLGKLLKYIKDNYNNPEIFITENGASDNDSLNDTYRIEYIKGYLNQILISINEDKVNVTRYTYWSLMDDFEWNSGYLMKMGLYHVDFASANKTRTAKNSAKFYQHVIKNRCLQEVCNGPEAKYD